MMQHTNAHRMVDNSEVDIYMYMYNNVKGSQIFILLTIKYSMS